MASAHDTADSAIEKDFPRIALRAALPAVAAGVEAAVQEHIASATCGVLLAEAAAHLLLFVVPRLRPALRIAALRLLLRVFRLLFIVLDFFLQFIVRGTVLFVGGVHLNGNLELLFALVHPVLFIEHDRLQVMPFGGALVELVEHGLRLVDFARADVLVHLRVRRAGVFGRVLFAPLNHDFVVRDVDAVEHARRFVARLPFEETLFRIFLFQFLVTRLDFLVGRGLGNAQEIVILFIHGLSFGCQPFTLVCAQSAQARLFGPDFIFASALHPLCGGGQSAQDDVVRQIVIEIKADIFEVLRIGREHALKHEIRFLAVLCQHLRARFLPERLVKGVVVTLLHVLVVVVERVDEVHPLADAVAQPARGFGGVFAEAVVGKLRNHAAERVGGHVEAGTFLLFQSGERLHVAADNPADFGVQGGSPFHPLFEEGALEPALLFVLHVVAEFIVGERGVEAGDGAGDVVVRRHRALDDGVQGAAPVLDFNIRIHYIVQKGGQKCHVIRKPEPRPLAAGSADALAQPAVQRLVQNAVLHVHMGNIRLYIPEQLSLLPRIESDLAVHFGEGSPRHARGALRAPLHDSVEICFIRKQLCPLRLDGRERVGDRFPYREFEIAVALALELLFRLRYALARERVIDGQQVGYARLFLGCVADNAVAVRHRALEFADNGVLIVGHGDKAVGVFVRLAHLSGRVGKAHDARAAVLRDIAVGDGERRAVAVVEADGEVARQLQVLFLVCADGHERRLVQKNVCRHEHGVVHEPHIDVFGMLGALVLELRHARKFARVSDGIEHPRQLAVRGHVRLHEQHALFGVDAAGDEQRHQLERISAQLRRLLPDGDGVQIGDGIDALVFVLQLCEIADGADIVADGDRAARLNGGEQFFLCCGFFHKLSYTL